MDEPRPKIPATCEQRPTIGGLVIPWINVQLADGGVDFRAQHESRSQRCFREGICQVCATLIARPPFVFLGGTRQTSTLQFDEPALHPECAAYVSSACPMVAGRMERFADRAAVSHGQRGQTCPEPGCDCGGWIPTPSVEYPAGGRPATAWYAVYASAYQCGVTAERPDRVSVAVVDRSHVLAVRHVSTPGAGRVWRRTTLEAAADG